MKSSFTTKIWIGGLPHPYIFYYRNAAQRVVPVELQSFRPDPVNYLVQKRSYQGTLFFETDTHSLEFLRKVIVTINGDFNTYYRF